MITIGTTDYPVVDAHVHAFAPELILERDTWLNQDSWFGQLYSPARSKLTSIEDLLISMAASGVDQSVVCGFPWRDAAHCRAQNTYLAAACAPYSDRLSWLGICPMTEEGVVIAEEAFAAGAVGLGEFNADAQGFSFTDMDTFSPIARLCETHDRPILIHCSEPVGHDYPGKGTATPERITDLAAAFPELRIVAAHWGGGLPFYELMPEVRANLANVAYDSGASTYLYDPSVFRRVIDLVGPEKVLFGSDYPVLGQKRLVASLAGISWTNEAEIAAILGGNAIRTYRLEFTR